MEPIQILWVNRSYTATNEGVKTHTHPYYHFFVLCSGTLDITVEGKTFHLEPGSAFLVPKNEKHSYMNYSEETVCCIEIKFTLQSPGLESRFSDRKNRIIGNDPVIVMLAEKIVEEYANLGSRADEAAKSYLYSILQVLTRSGRNQSETDILIDVTGYSELTRKVIAYLNQHHREQLSLEVMAKELSFNKAYLCTAFKKDTKITISDCLNLIRIRSAAQMISYSELSIGEVAKACGFGTASHFNHVFQHYIGTTPSAIRKAYPSHILLGPEARPISKANHPNRLMYNVLAGNQIPQATLKEHD